jgi:tetratricopeptide (TPR) repeat protein
MLLPEVVRRRRTSRWLTMLAVAAGAGVLARASIPGPEPSPCVRAVKEGEYRHGVDHCLASYEQTADPTYLRWAAEAYFRLNEPDRASELARRLLGGPRAADGHRILSQILLRTPRPGTAHEASKHAAAAAEAYERAGDERGLAKAMLALSQATWKAGDFAAALRAANRALELAERHGPASHQWAAHMARADALRRIGDRVEARAAMQRAIERATTACERTWTYLKSGMLHMEGDSNGLARAEMAHAEQDNRQCRDPIASRSLDHNLAWLLRRGAAAGALEKLDDLTNPDGETLETLLLRGYLAADGGALAEAEDYLLRAEAASSPDADWTWEVAQARAQLAELRGGPWGELFAEYHYRRATALAAELRRSSPAESAHLVSSHRGPYEGLIALLARAGRWREALAVILELDASDMLRATAAERVTRHRDSLDLAPSLQQPGHAVPPPPAKIEEVLAAWQARDLVIVIAQAPREIGSGRERTYRIRIAGGSVTGEDVGEAGEVRTWAEEIGDPTAVEAARELGRVIVPPDRSDQTLDVLTVGKLGKVPLAALRGADDALIVGRRPLARVLGLRPTAPAPAPATDLPVVLANPTGDLPGAALEGYVVASALGRDARLYGAHAFRAGTRARLLEAKRAEVLHVAAHVGELGRRRELRLAGEGVPSDEIVKAGIAPRLAVLASCGAAAAQDEEGWGSIAAALLQNGTEMVIATHRNIPDDMTLALMRAFYAQPDWRTDPARALARVQVNEPAKYAGWWKVFTVLRRPPG